ncbi:hypothetical protein [Micromonospora echinospora]|uniref:hypothetical protein n=1 Tax=Micromonospora echinospora TaxID=1877 RepID=UPI003A871378
MRTFLQRIGLATALTIATLGVGGAAAVAAPVDASPVATAGVRASAEVFIGYYPHEQCIQLLINYQLQGYHASCKWVTSTHSGLYVYV